MADYLFERFSDGWKTLINQAGVKAAIPDREGNEEFNAVWDGMCAPDGRFYYPISSEQGRCGTTKLGWYDFENNKVVECLDGKKVLMPIGRTLPHSKFHTSLNAIPRKALYPDAKDEPGDYLLIGTTHSTDRAPQHPGWMAIGYRDHLWEGFPGSQIVVFDPRDNSAVSLGIPVPRESIYGAKYDPKHNRLYMIGFMRGHVYCYDLNERNVIRDLGKAAELFCYRLVLGADGNIYGCTKSGRMFRINTDTVELETLDFRSPVYENNYVNNTWYRYMVQARNHSSGRYMYMVLAATEEMFRYEFATGKVTSLGRCIPGKGIHPLASDKGCWFIHGFDIDRYGVLWIVVAEWSIHNDTGYCGQAPCYLIRWDVDNGEEPYCCGAVGTEAKIEEYVSEVEYDPVYDILYCANTATERPLGDYPPGVLGIRLSEFREHYRTPGPVSHDPYLDKRPLTEEELELQKDVRQMRTEENVPGNAFYAFEPETVTPVRIWQQLPSKDTAQSPVIGMGFDPDYRDGYRLYAVCGSSGCFDTAAYVVEITDGTITAVTEMSDIDSEFRAWLRINATVQPGTLEDDIVLPASVGRRYMAKAAVTVDWNGGRRIAGTKDAFIAVINPDKSVFSLGQASVCGPVRAMVTDKARRRLWGISGDDEDMGYIFYYDDKAGLLRLGILNYNIHGYFDGPTAANVLSCISLSPDERYLAIGSCDRIGTVHVVDLAK